MYFRRRFSSFEEFQREATRHHDPDLGKDELELLEELEAADDYHRPRRRRRAWD